MFMLSVYLRQKTADIFTEKDDAKSSRGRNVCL